MEKAKLNVSKSKSGTFIVKAIFIDTNKEMTVQNFNYKDATSLHGKEVDVERDKGQIAKILLNGEAIYSKSSSFTAPKKHTGQQVDKQQSCIAYAPYNFIPLNDIVVEAEEPCNFDTYHNDRFTGYIDMHIEAKTPLYIRDTLTENQMREKEEKERNQERYIPASDFCSTAGRPRIPGSSLRGMTRTMVEIVSFGKFGFFDDKRLYYRGLADVSGLRKEYQTHMSSFDKNNKKTLYKISAGKLVKIDFDYFIFPADSFSQISKKDAEKKIRSLDESYREFTFYKVSEGYIVVSGFMQNKKRDWFIKISDNQKPKIKVPNEDIVNYRDDLNRSKDVPNLLELAKDQAVPCFYVNYKDAKGNDRVSFGHTGMFRLAYKKTIGEHIPENLQDDSKIDLAEAIFGNEKTFAGRVFFEDAFCSQNDIDYEGEKAITLLGPKPTTFQHYLEQKGVNLANHPKNLAHYNSDNNIRGNKFYWHKSGENWAIEDPAVSNEKTDSKINPIKAGTAFAGKIRFENLSIVELGALLFALDLPEDCRHKLGMGKPLGLGSVKITPKLFISDRTNRYTRLFAEWETPITEADKSEYKKAYESYVLVALKDSQQKLWGNERMKELKAMLDFKHKPSDETSKYMTMESKKFKERCVLSKPTEIVKRKT